MTKLTEILEQNYDSVDFRKIFKIDVGKSYDKLNEKCMINLRSQLSHHFKAEMYINGSFYIKFGRSEAQIN